MSTSDNKLVWIQVYENEKLSKVRGIRVGAWAMRPERIKNSAYNEVRGGPNPNPHWGFWHVDSGLRCDRGGGPKDVVLAFLNFKEASKVALRMSKATSRPKKEKIFYDFMARWGEFVCDREFDERGVLPTTACQEINKVRNILLDSSEYPLTPEHARRLARASEDVQQVLLDYAAEATRIKKARKAHAERWDGRW